MPYNRDKQSMWSHFLENEPGNSEKNEPYSSHIKEDVGAVFLNNNGFLTTTTAKNRLADIASIMDLFPDNTAIEFMNDDFLYDALSQTMCLSNVFRCGIMDKGAAYAPVRKSKINRVVPIEISQPEHAIFRLKLPNLMREKYKGSYEIYWYSKYKIEEFLKENPWKNRDKERLILIYKKYAPKLDAYNSCDNDNWECKRVTNAISESINFPDNAANFSFVYTAAESKDKFVEATLIKRKDLKYFTDYIAGRK